jgi:hypothetical protein
LLKIQPASHKGRFIYRRTLLISPRITATMDKLPAELVQCITDQISTDDIQSLLNLRGVCHGLKQQINKTFLKRCFETRKFTTSNQSMNQLIKLMKFSKFAPLVKHLIVDACFEVDDQASAAKFNETMKQFANKILESITFVHSADLESLTERMIAIGWSSGRYNPSTLFLQRFCDVTAVVCAFIHSMDVFDIKTLRFSIPGEEDLSIGYAVGPWVLNADQTILSALRQLNLHIFPSSIDMRTGIQSSPNEDAMGLASFINSAPQLSQLRLSFAAEGLKAYDEIWLTQLPNALFQALDLSAVEDVTLAGWQYPHWQSLLAFFEKHHTITRLRMTNVQIDAYDIPLHKSWVHILECLLLSTSLVDFSWQNLDTTSTARLEFEDDCSITCVPSSHRRACAKSQCDGRDSYLHCHQSGMVKGGHANVEAVLLRMIANFELPRTTLRQQIARHTETAGSYENGKGSF